MREVDGVRGTAFAVWAPNARSVSVVGDFNSWDGRLHPMRTLGAVRHLGALPARASSDGARYKFELPRQGRLGAPEADPYALATERPPQTASVVLHAARTTGRTREWLERRARVAIRWHEPISIYEVHLGSWRPGLDYRELAEQLGGYVRDLGFTHVELHAGDGAPVRAARGATR